jgi:hypothetical protein
VPSNPWCRPPTLSHASIKPRRWHAGSALPHIARARRAGATIRFTLSDAATVRMSFTRAHVRARAAKAASMLLHAHAGANAVRFQGRLSRRRRLHPGRYVLRLSATDALGSTSKPTAIRFTVLRKRRARSR